MNIRESPKKPGKTAPAFSLPPRLCPKCKQKAEMFSALYNGCNPHA